ncbi:MAG: CHASE3 domain-containing protein [Psychromonas sp.]
MASTETGQTGFLLTQDVNYRGIYHKGGALATTYLNNLLTLTADNPKQQQRLKHIQSLMDKKFAELQQTVELAQHKDIESYNLAFDIVKQNDGKKFMDEIRETLFAFEYEEHLFTRNQKRKL